MARPSSKQAQAKQEIGRNNLAMYGSVTNVSFTNNLNYIPSLAGLPLLAEMERMWYLDETVGAMAFCIQTTLAQAEWTHVPQIDGVDDDSGDADAKAAADFANTMLVDMKHTMQEHVEEAITMIPFGFAPCEIVCKIRDGKDSRFNDKLWGIDKLPLRDQFSIWSWQYEGEDPVAFRQIGIRGAGTVPLWKTLHYRMSSHLNNPNGRPYLLNVHRAWKLKNQIQDSEAIGIERDLCGLPTFRVPQDVLDEANMVDADGKPTPEAQAAIRKVQSAITAVSDMRFNRSGGLVMPSDTHADNVDGDRTPLWDFKLVTSAGQRSIDTRTAIRDYDRAIARVLMMQFLHLGDRSTGSFALSADQSDIGVKALMAIAMKIAGEWNKKLIPLIWQLNGMDPRYMPRLRAGQLNKDGIAQVGKFLSEAARGSPMWETDPVVRTGLLRMANLDYDVTAQRDAATTAAERVANEAKNAGKTATPFGGEPSTNTGDQP